MAPQTPDSQAPSGVSIGAYPLDRIDLRAPLRDPLTLDGACFLDPATAADLHALERLRESLFEVRSAVIETMHGKAFQGQLLALAQHLCGQHFSAETFFQKTPSLRLHMPGALGTSWHSDHWYGHDGGTRTFWIPLTPVAEGAGVSFINAAGFARELDARLLAGDVGLRDINSLCAQQGAEQTCAIGEYLIFSGDTLHGSVANASGTLRCSIDFRGCASAAELGNKPLANYRIVSPGASREAAPSHAGVRAVKYVCGADGTSTKYQHVLTEAYAHENAIKIVRNEAEIEALASLPVLSAYLSREAPTAGDYSAVLMYSMRGLPAPRQARAALLRHCIDQQVSLHFALEDKVFPGTMSLDDCLHGCLDDER